MDSTSDSGSEAPIAAGMEWFIMNSSGVRSLATGIVEKVGEDKYMVQDECTDVIEELLEKMEEEGPQTCVTKQHLLTERLVSKDLVPLIKFASPDTNELALVLKLLATLCEPIATETAIPASVEHSLRSLTGQIRAAFLDLLFVSKLFDHVKELIEEGGELEQPPEAYEAIKHLLMLVRNILYTAQHEDTVKQVALRSLLLKNDIGSIIIYSISCHSRNTLAVPVAQLLSQLYQTFEWDMKLETDEAVDYAKQFTNNKLRCLIVQLLQGSLSTLVNALQKQELRESQELSNVPWCLAFFLPYTTHVAVSICNLKNLLSSKCVSYLVYQVSMLSIDIFSRNQLDPAFQQLKERVMLIFSALESLISLVMDYKLASLNKEELKIAMQFYKELVEMSDLWRMLLLYIGNFDTNRFPRSFLSQLICTNHKLFTAIEFYNKTFCGELEEVVLKHFKQFATAEVIERYTLLVDTYSTNSEQTNLAVFTMLCHICVDCNKKDLLYTPTLLRLLGAITDNTSASDEDRELSSFVVQSFLDDLTMRPQVCVESFVKSSHSFMEATASEENTTPEVSPHPEWSHSEEDDLFSLFADVDEGSCTEDTVELLSNKLSQLGINRSREEIAYKLQQLGMIGSPADQQQQTSPMDVSTLVTDLVEEEKEDFVSWIQQELLTASFIKAVPKDCRCRYSPLCRYSNIRGHAYPLIPYSYRLSTILSTDKKSRQLLDMLELPYQPFNGSYLPHITTDRTAGELYTIAERLKSIETAVGAKLPMSCDSSTVSVSEEEEVSTVKGYSAEPAGPAHRGPSLGEEGNMWVSYYMRNT